MISRQDLRELSARFEGNRVPQLTVILNVDQTRAANLNRGFEAALKSLLKRIEGSVDPDDAEAFWEDVRRVTQFIADFEPEGKTVALLSCAAEDFFWSKTLNVGLETDARWGAGPYLKPLLEVREEAERCGVVLVDRARARFFTVFQGEVTREAETEATAEVKRFDGSGADQIRSQMAFQRKAHEHALWHLREVAETLEKLVETRRLGSIVLGGPHEVLVELKGLLPARTGRNLLGLVSLPVDSSDAEILEQTRGLQQKSGDEGSEEAVRRLLTAAAKNQQAVLGLASTLEALNQGRVRHLIYADRYQAAGAECGECQELFPDPVEACPYCCHPTHPRHDLLETMVERVFRTGGGLEQVRGGASELLERSGMGIGAYLRF